MKNRPYYAPIKLCTRAATIRSRISRCEVRVRTEEFQEGQHTSPEYMKINPTHKGPL